MADFNTKLELISRRGHPVGAEELIERIEAQLAGDPLVVVTSRRKGALMTKTDQPISTKPPGPGRGLVWALAAFVAILAVAGVYLATAGEGGEVAETTPTTVAEPTPTTAAVVETMTDLETIEAGVTAYYSGDADRAVELFELSDRTDDEIRDEAAYQAVIDGRVTLDCSESTPGTFRCRTPYHNAMTDAVGYTDSGDTNDVVVEDGVITEFGFSEHTWAVIGMGTFLASEGRFEGYAGCGFGPFTESCATVQLENLEAWADWQEIPLEAESIVELTLGSWYGGDCEEAIFLSFTEAEVDCPFAPDKDPSNPVRMISYEDILGAEVSVEGCQVLHTGDFTDLSCNVHYSNAMSRAVGKPPAVTAREFTVAIGSLLGAPDGEHWYQSNYPEDTELRESFRQFAEGGDLAAEYADAGCATNRTEGCAQLIVDNLDEWAAWHQENS